MLIRLEDVGDSSDEFVHVNQNNTVDSMKFP